MSSSNEAIPASVGNEAAIAATTAAAPPAALPSSTASRLASIAVASALFMEFIDSTALSTALPTLARAFHTDPVHLKLALTAYILALAVFAPASGWIADRFGAKRVFMMAMVTFLLGSVLCGFSHTLGELVAYRLVQGVGGAMMTPVGRLIVVGSTPRERLVSAMAWFTMPALIGPLLGPPVAGFVLGVADWPWIFFINVPVCVLGLFAVGFLVPQLREADPGRFDGLGFALTALAICLFVAAMETIGLGAVPVYVQLAMIALAALLSVAYVRHARKVSRPVLDLALLRHRTYRASLLGGTLLRLGIGASPFLLPLLLQVGLGWTPLKAGSVSVWQSVGALGAKPVVARWLKRAGYRTVLLASVAGSALLTTAPGFYRAATPVWCMIAIFVVSGFVRSNQFTATNTMAYADVPANKVSAASTLATVTQQVGLSLGISFGGAVLHLARGNGALTPDRFLVPYLAIGAVTLLAWPIFWRLPADAGASIGGRASRRP